MSDLGATANQSNDRAPMLVAVAFVLAAIWVIAIGIGKAVVRRSGHLTRDPRRRASASRRELEGFLRDQGARVAPNSTLADLEHVVRLELGLDPGPFTLAVARARYGPPEAAQNGATAARFELRGLLRAARRELSVWARMRGFVSLRSVRSLGAR